VLFFINIISAQTNHSPADSLPLENPKKLALDFLPPLIDLSFYYGVEFLPPQTRYFGIWVGGSNAFGPQLLSDLENSVHTFFSGVTWHPSKSLLGGAMYMRYVLKNITGELEGENKDLVTYKLSGHYITSGYLARGNLWKGWGYTWNLGLGVPLQDLRFNWRGSTLPKDSDKLGKFLRLVSCLDAGIYLHWSW